MAAQAVVPKDPSDVLDYTVNWANWLTGGATITAAVFTVETGITLGATSNTTTTAKARLSGGTVGAQYTITCQVTLTTGEIAQRSFEVAVEER